jgi:hypothetical protein
MAEADANPQKFLKDFYESRGIRENDLDSKYKVMCQTVRIPGHDYSKGDPSLSNMELQLLSENGFESLSPVPRRQNV